jgi:hypothetical protein
MSERPKSVPIREHTAFNDRTDNIPHWLRRSTASHPTDLIPTSNAPHTVFRVTPELTSKHMRPLGWRGETE